MRRRFRVPEIHCPACDSKLDACSSLDGWSPRAGDLTICIYCAEVLEFDAQLKPQTIEASKLMQIFLEDPDLAQGIEQRRQAVLQLKAKKENDRS